MKRKGFPESYDSAALLDFLARVKAGEGHVRAPVYSHLSYDVVPGMFISVDQPDILIVEGLNVLLPTNLASDSPVVSDFFDFSIYLHAEEADLEQWYVERFLHRRAGRAVIDRAKARRFGSLMQHRLRQVATGAAVRVTLATRDAILAAAARLGVEVDHAGVETRDVEQRGQQVAEAAQGLAALPHHVLDLAQIRAGLAQQGVVFVAN